MKWLLIIVGSLVALALLVAVIGMLLPRAHQATSEIVLRQPPDSVWSVVRDPAALQGTWADLKSVRRLNDQTGREIWEEDVGGFPMRLVVTTETRPTELITTIDAPPEGAFGGRWVYRIASTPDGGSRVSVTEDGWIRNPFFRVMANVMGLHRTLDGYLTALGRRFSEEVTPVHVR
jgi:uncharacterized protein YndB with AHSA1/START domain